MNQDLIVKNETNKNSMGGTELLQQRLYDGSVPRELLEKCQIVFSRVRDLDESKFRVYYAHDLPGDPESEFLKNGGHSIFHYLVFVSNWQMQAYINYYNIPWSKCVVIPNSIYPVEKFQTPKNDKIKLIYTSTPHRGLNILYSAFNVLCTKYDNIELDVYSSFKLYGWKERDNQYKGLFDLLESHPKINYHGTASNDEVREALNEADIFAYPSIWQETSCLCLIEAMSAGLLCVHPNYAALPETAANWTMMYQWNEDINRHANIFYNVLDNAIQNVHDDYTKEHLKAQSSYINNFHNWSYRSKEWIALLSMLINTNPDKKIQKPAELFSYSMGQ